MKPASVFSSVTEIFVYHILKSIFCMSLKCNARFNILTAYFYIHLNFLFSKLLKILIKYLQTLLALSPFFSPVHTLYFFSVTDLRTDCNSHNVKVYYFLIDICITNLICFSVLKRKGSHPHCHLRAIQQRRYPLVQNLMLVRLLGQLLPRVLLQA